MQTGIPSKNRPRPFRPDGHRAAIILGLGLVLLAAGCMRLTYDETPTPASDTVPSSTLIPTVAGAPAQAEPQAGPQDETTPPTPADQGPAVLRTDPAVLDLTAGETHLVEVWLDNIGSIERLHSIELHITFEPRTMRVEDAAPDTQGVQINAGASPGQVVWNEVDNETGLIIYQATQAPGSPASGSSLVASFTVRALADGGSPLQFHAVSLRDAQGQPLPAPQQVDGLAVIGPGDTTPEPVIAAPTTVPGSPGATEYVQHTVQAGENLFRIALHYGTTVEAIVTANQLSDPSAVQVGQVLRIPTGSPASTATYVVQPGDTLYAIADRFDTTVERLAALNGLASPYTIQVGQVLIVTP